MPEIDLGLVRGPQGKQGETGSTGPQGKQGIQGIQGEAGKSAYQAARDGGYTGSEAEFNAIMAIIEKHAGRHKTGGADPLTAADVGAAPAYAGTVKANSLLDWAKSQTASVCGFASPSNIPNDLPVNKAGYAFVSASGAGGWSVLYYCAAENSIYFNMTNSGIWLGWKKLAGTDYAVNKAGDTIPGARFELNNGLAKIMSDALLFQISAYETVGAATNSAHLQLYNAANATLENLLRLAVYDASGSRKNYNVLHTGNKPSGEYPGTNSETSQTILTGAIGNMVLICGNGKATVVTKDGGVCLNDGSVISASEVKFAGGTLTIASRNAAINASLSDGKKYQYAVV